MVFKNEKVEKKVYILNFFLNKKISICSKNVRGRNDNFFNNAETYKFSIAFVFL